MEPEDVVWIHDYHLMLLPQLLRQQKPAATIGFFLHIPFPSFELFRLLPQTWRAEILEGLLGADLIGFHTYDYAQHFLRSVLRVLGHEHTMGKILLPNHLAKVDTFPMGVTSRSSRRPPASRFTGRMTSPETLAGLKVVLSVDRLDYTKGSQPAPGLSVPRTESPVAEEVVLVLVVAPADRRRSTGNQAADRRVRRQDQRPAASAGPPCCISTGTCRSSRWFPCTRAATWRW
jgi:trehalose 6-phosphate synthase/phosphatase